MKTYRIPVLTLYEEFYVVNAESADDALKIFNGSEPDTESSKEYFEDESNPVRVLSSNDYSVIEATEMIDYEGLYVPQEIV